MRTINLRAKFPSAPLAFGLLLSASTTQAAPSANIERHKPYNLFEPSQNVQFLVQVKELPEGATQARASVTDYDGVEVLNKTFPVQGNAPLNIDLGTLKRGYHELKVQIPGVPEAKATFGVMEFVQRSAAEARAAGSVFGVKWWGGVANQREGAEALSKLGLQWTRVIQNQSGKLTTKEMLTDFPLNAVIKIERFPKELYDAEKYGPLDEWEKKYGRGSWTLKTLPKKEPYQAYLRQQLADNVPADQQVFEIWNEPWDKMSPEDFATLSQWIAEVVLKDRPNAILGPNLAGSTSSFEYDARVIKAGGLKNMKMVALHPYGNATDRAWLRDYRQWLNQQTGTAMDLYITEYGSHSTPQGPNRRSEQDQARRIVLQSLALYAEGAKALIPHWLGQAEGDPTYLENWFGFVRNNEQPKPALLAHANTARLIDGSQYLGDLWFGPRVGAMLFRKNGTDTLALWTENEASGSGAFTASKEIELQPGVKQVAVVAMDGEEHQETVKDGKLTLKLTDSPLYVVGVSPDLARGASKELRADRWPKPEKPARLTREARKFTTPPVLDGNFDDWKGMTQIGLTNPKVSGADASGIGYLGWDDNFLYIGLDMRDNEMLNVKPRGKLYQQDSVELFLSTTPRESGSGYGPGDYQFFLTPTSGEGKPILGRVTDREAGIVTDVKGGRIFAGPTQKADRGWALEAAIPWAEIPPFQARNGAKVALEMRVNDADTSHERFKIDASDLPGVLSVLDPSTWSLLEFQDANPGQNTGVQPIATAATATTDQTVAPAPLPAPVDTRAEAFKAVPWDISQAGTPLNLDGYKMTFEDNFDTLSLTPDGGKGPWFAPIHSDVGVGKLMPPGPEGPFSVADGILTVRSKKVDGKWQNGMMQTVDSKGQGFAQQYGYFEMRAQMPAGPGSWAAFWLLSQNGFTDYTKTRCEIDVVEWYGADPKGHHTTVHLWPARQRQPDGPLKHVGKSQYSNFMRWQERFKLDAPPLVGGQLDGWHTYGGEVTKDWVIIYFDRHELARFPTQPEYRTPIYPLVDLIINPPEAKVAVSPMEMKVDYVRVYAK